MLWLRCFGARPYEFIGILIILFKSHGFIGVSISLFKNSLNDIGMHSRGSNTATTLADALMDPDDDPYENRKIQLPTHFLWFLNMMIENPMKSYGVLYVCGGVRSGLIGFLDLAPTQECISTFWGVVVYQP